ELAAGLEQMLDGFERLDPARISARAVERFGYPAVAAQWDEIYRDLAGAA
ncbi:MAG: hypothetical protein HOQ03_04465, partial [Thermoleophilia bacterium]|nr:hypothetical protein [Thermoleophilia bacterium]